MSLPVVAITMGDPAGIGPEIIVKALGEREVFAKCRPLVLGDGGIFSHTIHWMEAPLVIKRIKGPEEGEFAPGVLNLIPLTDLPHERISVGKPYKEGGKAAYIYIQRGVTMAKEGTVDALVTAPISKEALNSAGYHYPGHTELLADMTGTKDFVMMLVGPKLRVALVTIHIPLREVSSSLTIEKIRKTIEITFHSLQDYFGIRTPKLAVAALNPHAGEGGLFGFEEEEIILPAIWECRREGIELDGPFPPDSLFFHAAQGKYDAVISMYHDQGLIPLKLLHFKEGVNVTLGLPIVRTSVDHGTGYDIAGHGVADPTSLINAIVLAAQMAMTKKDRR
ncbi:MAG: 4-hydroxythreonine-4-phosphate dehydrogenase PdxA [Deltaproteobacteria bacterium]|nr:MAG: 4-hydroxythreonine-4-phosphate dehydrogenase PdxA [Deltaproteobacteria bacterium]